ncbi:TPA: TIGR02646 family protein [Providencia rettgeri]|nr:TIGR02646 family protein [Providencia rettgeri]
MRKLDRTAALLPRCLSKYTHLTHTWDDVHSYDKRKIWNELYKVQGRLCVYCEGKAERGNGHGHIEHFFHKGEDRFKCWTFEWSNLFGCCDSRDHCGHFKDQTLPGGIKMSYIPEELIKPDIDDPDDFFQFSPTGKIKEKDNISEEKKKRALSTISALNLGCSELNSNREAQINRFRERLLVLTSIELIDDATINLVKEQFQKILDEAMNSIYRTALKQAITW